VAEGAEMKNLFINGEMLEINGVKILDYQQPITSAETCRNQKAAGARLITDICEMPSNVLDFGGGKYSEAQNYIKLIGGCCEVYDPYNRTREQNIDALSKKYDVMMCNNVLNVLTDDVIQSVIHDMQNIVEMCEIKKIIVTVYERDKSGVGCYTNKNSYQRNEKTSAYIEKLRCFTGISKHKKALVVHV
jgi:hypothetical protein